VAYGLQSYIKKDTMEVAGLCHKILVEERPRLMCIDIGGLGAGVYDRLMELGHSKDVVIACNSGSIPIDSTRYVNKRAEMWGETKLWLGEAPCQIPDSDTLHADLCGTRYSFDSQNRLKLERKEDMKKRGVRSSDEADALCLTHYVPPTRYMDEHRGEDSRAQFLMSGFNKLKQLKQGSS
jgi:hypothetical protein